MYSKQCCGAGTLKKKEKAYLGFIPARGGSKRIPGKNIRRLCGRPLIQYTIDAALKSGCLDRIVVSTDDDGIAEVAKAGGAEVPFLRPDSLCTDQSPTIDSITHCIRLLEKEAYLPDAVVVLQPTSPLRSHDDISKAIEIYEKTDRQTVVGVCDEPIKVNTLVKISTKDTLPRVDVGKQTDLQSEETRYRVNGAIYVTDTNNILDANEIFGECITAYMMPWNRSVDIDNESDWRLAEMVITTQNK